MASHNANEQYLLELINRARLDPLAELERYNDAVASGAYTGQYATVLNDLNDSLAPGSISTASKQVLAHNSDLQDASSGHSLHMLAVDEFDHSGIGNGTIGSRATDAGYSYNNLGENISWNGTTGTVNAEASIDRHHYGLFRSEGHRNNLMREHYTETGLAQEIGVYTTSSGTSYNASMLTEMFGNVTGRVFLTGVVYNDTDGDDFYSIGEGTGGVGFSANGASATTTSAGGYGVQTSNGTHSVSFGTAQFDVIVAGQNVKLDLVDGDTLLTSGSVNLTSGIETVRLLGLDDLDVTGSAAGETILGNSGANDISAGGGDDTVHAGEGADNVMLGDGDDYVKVGGGAENFDGGAGKDYISYFDSTGGITANLATNTISGSWADDDTFTGFESIAGSNTGDDVITGTNGANVIKTFGGDDKVFAGKGADVVQLGSGNDYVKAGGGRESFDGGSGRDYISYANSGIGVRIDLAADTISGGWGGNDTIKNFEGAAGSGTGADHLSGHNGTNTLRGLGGNDNLNGRGGDDRLFGGDGKDRLDGGEGTDDLFGGGGADKFHFDLGDGADTIKDFQNNIDTIQLDNFVFAGGVDAFDFADQVGTDVVFTFDSGDMLTVENTNIGALANDLVLV